MIPLVDTRPVVWESKKIGNEEKQSSGKDLNEDSKDSVLEKKTVAGNNPNLSD